MISHCCRARVLGLVDQHMVDPLVELEQHPVGALPGCSQQPPACARSGRRSRGPRAAPCARRRRSDRGPDPKQRRGALGDRRRRSPARPRPAAAPARRPGPPAAGVAAAHALVTIEPSCLPFGPWSGRRAAVVFPGPLPLVDLGGQPGRDDRPRSASLSVPAARTRAASSRPAASISGSTQARRRTSPASAPAARPKARSILAISGLEPGR